ncbi:RGCVC family protein [Pseudonocardia humida]|uniref:RGCVC family protein n=1 Tax=Pseudonocardia humida TaxID=2800819 RepID=A0ABT0ZTG9_9PSEU|nr:RGCVC family protein [Pseudonocardia humida]MCO1654019.1 RGCVC family protein [Pseudonocardia humida]
MRWTRSTPAAATSPASPTRLVCAACPHDWGAHDPVATRFCTATMAGRLDRDCVCAEVVSLFSDR